MSHVNQEMRDYIHNNDHCRRNLLIQAFEAGPISPQVTHMCCDVRTRDCSYGSIHRRSSHNLVATKSDSGLRPRLVSPSQKQLLEVLLKQHAAREKMKVQDKMKSVLLKLTYL